MESFSNEEHQEAQEFIDFYINAVENKNCIRHNLAEDVTLDWFGRTIRGEKNVLSFFKSDISQIKHFLNNAVPAEKIGFRDTHVIKLTKIPKRLSPNLVRSSNESDHSKTPPKPSTSSVAENGQGDGLHVNNLMSPVKKFKPNPKLGDFLENSPESDIIEGETEGRLPQIKNVIAEGYVQFHKPSLKKLQSETKWKRPCKLNIAYTSSNSKDNTIYLIIYEGNVKCRRNLLKEFESTEPEK